MTTEARHPVRVVAQRTGLTPATLRAWERRYGVVTPGRSEGGQRLYTDEDVERLKILHELTEGGRSIGRVAELTTEEARALLAEDRRAAPAPPRAESVAGDTRAMLEQAMELARTMDGSGLEAHLRRAAVALGVTTFLDELVVPFLRELGEGWTRGEISPAQEHVASEVVDGVLSWLAQPAGPAGRPVLVVGTLPGESHRLGARLVAATAVFEGWQVSYLGADLPGREIARAAETVGAAVVAVSSVSSDIGVELVEELEELEAALGPDTPILLGGRTARSLAAAAEVSTVQLIDGLDGLREALRSLG